VRSVTAVRVLICDDEPSIRLLFRTAFEDEGAEVVEAVDGDDCLALADRTDPDLVILDLFMPNRDGLSALPELTRSHPEARVLVVSAHAAVDIFRQSRARGATACFDKLNFLPRIPQVMERYGPTTAA
jgi:two-component system, NarL family, invasion response regulator UvrY